MNKQQQFNIGIWLLCSLLSGNGLFAQQQFYVSDQTQVVITGNALLVLDDMDFINEGDFLPGTGTVQMIGDENSNIESPNGNFHQLKIDKQANNNVLLNGNIKIQNNLEFTGNGNLIEIDSSDINLSTGATILNYNENNFVLTDSTGRLVKKGMSNFTYPVGASSTTYNPISLTENGVIDTIGVRCLANVLADGLTGTPLNDIVDASWEITEDNIGDANIDLTAQWTATDELGTFDRTTCGITFYNVDWDNLTAADLDVAMGSDPYTQTRTGITQLGLFAISNLQEIYVDLAPKIFLQGPYVGSMMSDALRIASIIPTTEPFTGMTGFNHVGNGGGESIDPTVLNITGSEAIVDWVFLELRDKTNANTILQTKSALLQRDGDVVDIDGSSSVRFDDVNSDDYYLSIRHRNHLGVRTPSTLPLSKTNTSYDFTSALSQAYGADAMANMTGVFGLWAGDANGDLKVRYSDIFIPPFTFIPSDALAIFNELGGVPNAQNDAYSPFDLNMDGKVRYSDIFIPPFTFIPSDALLIFNVLGGIPNAQKNQNF